MDILTFAKKRKIKLFTCTISCQNKRISPREGFLWEMLLCDLLWLCDFIKGDIHT